MKSTLLIRLFNGVWLCVLFYLLWIYPYLDSPTPIRDILKVLLAYFMPLALAVALAFWSQLRLMKKYQNGTLPPLPTNWREQVPPEWVKLTLQSVAMAIVSVVLGMVVFSLIFKQLAVWIFGEF
ncbi:hypothetical protein [Moraxella equi]|uniref:Uncharacterized protein n=2 Tax=Moraxella equi TaxID=60442 RepID=A0A378QRX6_9GAMM|nr:hypothetical protein [Moraxella equi]OPH39926.1 hypothetical protein B5J93_01655 [Moraxella equi]STZ03034.1 Uncharacterised protein [Moraxella equi]